MKNGIHDLPINDHNEDTFGVDSYVTALSNFIAESETPITIALQGGWGTGKTSFINLTMKKLEKMNEENASANNFIPVTFNTWQYSQFNLQENLGISFLSYMIDKLSDNALDMDEIIQKAKEVVAAISLIGLNVALAKVGTQYNPKEKGEKLIDPAKAIEELKKNLTEIVEKRLQAKGENSRLVIFIDDLDRLNPVVTVSLLEIIKLFLDIKGCIFVLAVDNKVIQQGIVASKNTSKEKTKSFLDKMIQVPFKLPIEHYNYLSFLSSNIDWFTIDEIDTNVPIGSLENLIRYSVRNNPRGIKRLINNYLLNRQINALLNGSSISSERKLTYNDIKEEILLLSVICMQLSFQPLYITLINAQTYDEVFHLLNLKDVKDDETYKTYLLSKLVNNKLADLYEEDYKDDLGRYIVFLELLTTLLKDLYIKDGDGKMNSEEVVAEFMKIMKRAQLTSGTDGETNYIKREGTGEKEQINISEFIEHKNQYMQDYKLDRNPIIYRKSGNDGQKTLLNPMQPMKAFKVIVEDLFADQQKFEELKNEEKFQNSTELSANLKLGYYYGPKEENHKKTRQVILNIPGEDNILALGHHLGGYESIYTLYKILSEFGIKYDPSNIQIIIEKVKKLD
ncbi:KAP family P-loop NTPase fold protein [Macrococcus bovicus]|uniref:KAP NTPase domain-containing protein n=1 Tax=Macrococcus bovicus TaxID=69968 RepID=A0A4R6C047_9STAP|nr:P-loop NTPase fold protein [Macrococcus bovicus]TDM14316.1 hypothetical protein ERX55_05075 [Macrococcus bovicus]